MACLGFCLCQVCTKQGWQRTDWSERTLNGFGAHPTTLHQTCRGSVWQCETQTYTLLVRHFPMNSEKTRDRNCDSLGSASVRYYLASRKVSIGQEVTWYIIFHLNHHHHNNQKCNCFGTNNSLFYSFLFIYWMLLARKTNLRDLGVTIKRTL